MSVKDLVKISGICFILSGAFLGSGCGADPLEKALKNGSDLEEKGRFAEAMAEYDRAIELDPKSVDAYYHRALLFQRQGDSKSAFADFDRITAISPNYSEPYYGRGEIYSGQGQKDKAFAEYTKAIQTNINYGLAYYKRSLIYQSNGEYRKALDDALKARGIGIAISEDFLKELREGASRQG